MPRKPKAPIEEAKPATRIGRKRGGRGGGDDEGGGRRPRANGHFYPHGEERDSGPVISEYIYRDADGEPHQKVERTASKKFPVSHWENNGWRWGAPRKRLPYMLPQLIAAPSAPVLICEGEKDTETAMDLGFVATTNPGGAGQWVPELGEWLVGRAVFVIGDNDDPGRKHSVKVAQLLTGVASSIKIIELFPRSDDGADLTDWVAAGGDKKKLKAAMAEAEEFKGLTIVKVNTGHMHAAVEAVDRALEAAKRPVLVRAGRLMEPLYTDFPTGAGHKTRVTVLRELTPNILSHILTKHVVSFQKWDKRSEDYKICDPPDKLLTGYLEHGHWRLPHVAGVINAPTLRPDGTLLIGEGWDEGTRLWHWPDKNLKLPNIPDKPNRKDAEKALGIFNDLLEGFPFESDLDRSVAYAAILTTVLRGAFDVSPMFAFFAHAAGTGKSYLVDVISAIATGRHCPVITASPNGEEMEKRLGALVLEGVPMISLDNCSHDLRGDLLCQMTERPVIRIRILGESRTQQCEWRGMLFATGNNIAVAGDMVRRSLVCNLDAAVERPELRRFASKPIKQVLDDRGKYLAAALTIARSYIAAGRPKDNVQTASYEGWSRIVRSTLLWLGCIDPVKSIERAREEDPETRDFNGFFEAVMPIIEPGIPFSSMELADLANKTERGEDMDVTRVHRELYELLIARAGASKGTGVDPRRVGWWLRSIKGRVYSGQGGNWRLTQFKGDRHGNKWSIERVASS